MRDFRILMSILLMMLIPGNGRTQVYSVEASYSPASTTLDVFSTRYGYHYSNMSHFYMRYNDSAYLCNHMLATLYAPNPAYLIFPLEESCIITDFKKLNSIQGFIGSYRGVGMHGRTSSSLMMPGVNYQILYFLLPFVDRLQRAATAQLSIPGGVTHMRAFAIGEKKISGTNDKLSCLLDFYADGIGVTDPYYYAQLPYNLSNHTGEFADDVITFKQNVVFATRDTRVGNNPINLRISDTSLGLSSSIIKIQQQLHTPPSEVLSSKIRLVHIGGHYFVVVYSFYDLMEDQYYLCYHKINIKDFYEGYNTIVSHEIPIEKEFCELTDVIYEPDRNTMVILMNGAGRCELYHVDPNLGNVNGFAYKIEYDSGNLYSLDTVMDPLYSPSERGYVAVGDNDIFYQDISSGYTIINSCKSIIKKRVYLRDVPVIIKNPDPIVPIPDMKQPGFWNKPVRMGDGTQSCMVY